eukprot:CAMPEP_0116920474 /NCGR_PEP_ID=MMETSP0467-20121206/21039_1 /TAXON_ID=283647 /ORGANISM="Mesodinium pulex, Strain SPMC105" /LENGTH=95 /DNA_ID=CAMNT_0004598323 /DNA_START=112 /DNA_END=399 /DNA_ORIENTATION=-
MAIFVIVVKGVDAGFVAFKADQRQRIASLPKLQDRVFAAAGHQVVIQAAEYTPHNELGLSESSLLAEDDPASDRPHVDLPDGSTHKSQQVFAIFA